MATSARSGTRVGIYGGAFDPPHLGHVVFACEAAWQLELDEVRMVPLGQPVHRDPPHADADARYRMVAAAVADLPQLVPSRLEVDRSGASYTVDTLRAIVAAEPGVELTLLIGADQLRAFGTWREPGEILRLARLGVVARAETDREELARVVGETAPGRADVVAMPRIDISSTLVRERLAEGRPFVHLVPPAVGEMIHRSGLYRGMSALA